MPPRPPRILRTKNIPERFREILDHINYPHVPTLYGPVDQLGFARAADCARTSLALEADGHLRGSCGTALVRKMARDATD
jgi:hypothetical protein